jgi:hypothetical protein
MRHAGKMPIIVPVLPTEMNKRKKDFSVQTFDVITLT